MASGTGRRWPTCGSTPSSRLRTRASSRPAQTPPSRPTRRTTSERACERTIQRSTARHEVDERQRGGGMTNLYKDHRDVLIAPVVSEKSYSLLDQNKYTFLVHRDSNKTEIKIAVEQVFNVKVT